MRKPVTINLPTAAIERIDRIVGEHSLFEDQEDFILHAVTDLLEEYAKK